MQGASYAGYTSVISKHLENSRFAERGYRLGRLFRRGISPCYTHANFGAAVSVSPESPGAYRFGVFEFDARLGELRKQGMKLKLQGQPLDILAKLLERPGEVVTREDLQKKLWASDTFVDFDHSLNAAIKRLRDALDDSAETPRYIETLARRGYRFIAPVEAVGRVAASRRGALVRRGPLMAAGGFLALLAILVGLNLGGLRERLRRSGPHPERIESLAVLPLQNLSGDTAQDYFADGMTEELTTDLAQISSLRVVSRSSTADYKGTKKPLPQIARELNVDGIVEGSVQRSGDSVRVTAQLLYGPTDQHLWAQSYERPMSDVLVLQDEIARTISKEVGGKLNPMYPERTFSHQQINPEAYELYLRGSSYFDDFDLNKSVDYLNQAIKLDPNYAPIYAKMADAYYFLGFFNLLAPNVAFPRMKDAAQNALAKDETLAEAHGTLALVKLHFDWDFPGAEKEFKRALELNPSDADIRHDYSHFLMAMGRFDEATAESARAVELNPVDIGLTACLCWHRYSAHQYGQSAAQAQKTIQLAPDLFWTHIILGWDYEQEKKYEEAISEFQKGVKLSSGMTFALAALGHAYAIAGKKQETQETLVKLKDLGEHGYVSAFDMGVIYAGTGDKEKAFEWLEKAFQERSLFLIYSRWEPRLDPLRSDPRFSSLLRRIGLSPT
jgi:TolB-like protein/DNA-binding winged helix-turn-helix (wHTH) protein/Flp pilus assembly protein TadD